MRYLSLSQNSLRIEHVCIASLFLIVAIILIAIISNHIYIHKLNKRVEQKAQDLYDKMVQDTKEMKRNIENESMEYIKNALDAAVAEIANKSMEKNSKKDLATTFAKLRESIKDNTSNVMNNTGAIRIAVYLFHNGTKTTHGIDFFKFSCICEKVVAGSGVKEQSMNQSNIPVNLFDPMLDSLINNGRYIIIKSEDLENTNQRIFISSPKINYSQAVGIFDNKNNLLGFVLAEMDKTYNKHSVNEEYLSLKSFVAQIVPALAYSDYISVTEKNN